MQYLITSARESFFISVNITISSLSQGTHSLQLPAWRPGRYSLGNFSQNIKAFTAKDELGKNISFVKSDRDTWELDVLQEGTIEVSYLYYAAHLDAGSTFYDGTTLLINPVNCLMYLNEQKDDTHSVQLDFPIDSPIATSLVKNGDHWEAKDFDQLADSPILLSNDLQHHSFRAHDTTFHLWFGGGPCRPDFAQIEKDFRLYTQKQVDLFGDFPVSDYHYLFVVPPYRNRHGVEHCASTVIAWGPGCNLMDGQNYEDFLGISSHELFHTWNIKALRPAEMYPYDFSGENYSDLGYIAEGVTTYYGDVMLARSGALSSQWFLKELSISLTRHYHNDGRWNESVRQSSRDTWVDGYGTGIPGKKTSIYNEGSLCAWMMDLTIRIESNHQHSLDDVLRALYQEFACEQKGYTEQDYLDICKRFGGDATQGIFDRYLAGREDYIKELESLLKSFNYGIRKQDSSKASQSLFGLKLSGNRISEVAVCSPAFNAGLHRNDKIISINSIGADKYLENWFAYFAQDPIRLSIERNTEMHEVTLSSTDDRYFQSLVLEYLGSGEGSDHWYM